MDVIYKTSSGVTKAFNILLPLLFSIFTASIMNGAFEKKFKQQNFSD